MKNVTGESVGKPLSNTVTGTPETENHLDTVAESVNSAVRSAQNIGKDYKDKKKQKRSKTDKKREKDKESRARVKNQP
ncbi:hypothetical protein Tco_1128603, partial [Tanacetum coccineum]